MFPFAKVIFIIWIVFWIGWVIAALTSRRSTYSSIRRFVGFRIIFFIIIVAFFSSTHHNNFKGLQVTHSDVIATIGFIVFIIGLLTAVWARLCLGKNWGMPMSQKQSPELVTSGPYNYIRHPIYTGILLGMFGTAVATSMYLMVIFVIFAIYFIYSAVTEEKLMTKEFPKVYPAYKARTKMLIPFIF
jgi:protein-S-isoprenylcysteine O-methyltransferase Ste14